MDIHSKSTGSPYAPQGGAARADDFKVSQAPGQTPSGQPVQVLPPHLAKTGAQGVTTQVEAGPSLRQRDGKSAASASPASLDAPRAKSPAQLASTLADMVASDMPVEDQAAFLGDRLDSVVRARQGYKKGDTLDSSEAGAALSALVDAAGALPDDLSAADRQAVVTHWATVVLGKAMQTLQPLPALFDALHAAAAAKAGSPQAMFRQPLQDSVKEMLGKSSSFPSSERRDAVAAELQRQATAGYEPVRAGMMHEVALPAFGSGPVNDDPVLRGRDWAAHHILLHEAGESDMAQASFERMMVGTQFSAQMPRLLGAIKEPEDRVACFASMLQSFDSMVGAADASLREAFGAGLHRAADSIRNAADFPKGAEGQRLNARMGDAIAALKTPELVDAFQRS